MPTLSTAQCPSWTGVIRFGKLDIPVQLIPATSDEATSFTTVHDANGGELKDDKICSVCDSTVELEHSFRGVPTGAFGYSHITDDELEALATPSRDTLELRQFTIAGQIHPAYYERTYYPVPTGDGNDAYATLREALICTNCAGIGKIAFGGRERLAAVVAEGKDLVLHVLRFPSEVRLPIELGLDSANADDVARTVQLIKVATRVGAVEQSSYRDEYTVGLRRLVAYKQTTVRQGQRRELEASLKTGLRRANRLELSKIA